MLVYAVPNQTLATYSFREAKRARLLVKLPTIFDSIEVPQGCYVKLAAEVSYVGSYLMDETNSGRWPVFYVAQLMKFSSGVVQDMYEKYRLWNLS